MKFSKGEIVRYDRAIGYIKKKNYSGRHIIACLGSAGFTFISDVNRLADYCDSIGQARFAEFIRR
jgi:hypothetical protein